MNRLGLIFGVVFGYAISAYGQTVSNITFDGVGDSSVRVLFNVNATYSDVQLRYGTSSCAGGSGGTVQPSGTVPFSFTQYAMTVNLSGLAPSTTYHVCPEVTTDGAAWSRGADATFTTKARTQVLPIPPTPVPTNFPTQTGATRLVSSDCSNLQAQINAALPGDTIVVPAGTICTGAYTTPLAPDAKSFTSSNVATSTSTLAITAHGFADNAEVRLSTDGCLPGMALSGVGQQCEVGGGGWIKGRKYWVHVVDANHVQILDAPGGSKVLPGWVTFTADATADTISILPRVESYSIAVGGYSTNGSGSSITSNTPIQFVSTGTLPGGLSVDTTYYWMKPCAATTSAPCVSQVSTSPGGAAVKITSPGTGVHTIVDRGSGNMYIAPAPTFTGPWVLITTSGTLPPAGTRIDTTLASQMFSLRNDTLFPAAGYSTPRFQPGILAHNWRIVGANFDTGSNNDYQTSTDPRPYCAGPSTGMDNSYIMFDQVRVTGRGAPQRFGCKNNASNMVVNGANIGFINSYMSGMDVWHPWISGLVPTRVNDTTVTATAGVIHSYGLKTTTTSTMTITLTGGSATGIGNVSGLMDGTIRVQMPAGTTGTCTVSGARCNVTTAGSPDWPTVSLGGSNRAAGVRLFTITLSGGNVTSADAADAFTAYGPPQIGEGSNAIIAGNGPGPYIFSNNYISGSGLTLHFDDSGAAWSVRGDYTITGNTFDVPASQNATQPGSDGLRYGNRQPLEWKGGQRVKLDGNIFQGCFAEMNPVGVCVAVTPRSQGYVTDFDVTNNTFLNSVGGINLASPISSFAPVSKPGARQRFSNNLFLLNGWNHNVSGNAPRGWAFYGGYAMEDITIDHNTVYDNRGADPSFIHWVLSPAGGVSITNNIYFYTGNGPMLVNENIANCGRLNDKAMMDCAFTSGPGKASYTFTGNIIIPSWSDTSGPSGFVGKDAVTSALGSLAGSNFVPAGASQAANVSLVKFNADYTLNVASPYLSVCGGSACGFTIAPPRAAAPRIDRVLNGASFAGGEVAPGEIVAIKGVNLGPAKPVSLELNADGKVSTSSGGVLVLFNGFAAPLLYVSDTQINAVVPYEVADATDLSVVVTFQEQTSDAYALILAPATPALFTLDGSGSGSAAILNQDSSMNTPANAAAKGSQIVLYLTGEGQTTPPGVTGRITSTSIPPLPPQPLLPVSAIINGSVAPVLFYGETPGQIAGLMQVNVRIPETAPSGDLTLVVAVGIKSSPPGTTVSVQ